MSDHDVLPLLDQISTAVSEAIRRARPELAEADPVVRRSEHADFQANAALALAKRARVRPSDLAAELVAAIDSDCIDAAEVSGPGFLNITLSDRAVWSQVAARLANPRLGVGAPKPSATGSTYLVSLHPSACSRRCNTVAGLASSSVRENTGIGSRADAPNR